MARKKIITHNPDPSKWTLVKCKEGDYLRAKRGSKKPAVLNDAMRAQAENTCSADAKQILDKLKPYTTRMFGRKNVYLSGLLRKAKIKSGGTDYSLCAGWEVNMKWPMDMLYMGQIKVVKEKDAVHVDVPHGEVYFKMKNKKATHYYFEAMFIHGDAAIAGHLRIETDRSELYDIVEQQQATCRFSFVIPEGRPYLVFLKAGCMDRGLDPRHAKHYGMQVVAVG